MYKYKANFYNNIEFVPLKSQDEIQELVKKYHEGDMEARKTLIETNMRLAFSRQYRMIKYFALNENLYFEQDDFAQCGLLGLIKGIDSYDETKNVAFSTYVSKCIDNELLLYLRNMNRKNKIDALSLDAENENKTSIIHFVKSDQCFEEEIMDKDVALKLLGMIEKKPEQIRKCFEMFFGLVDGVCYKQADIADILKISQPYVSIIIKRELEKMKRVIEDNTVDVNTKKLIK